MSAENAAVILQTIANLADAQRNETGPGGQNDVLLERESRADYGFCEVSFTIKYKQEG